MTTTTELNYPNSFNRELILDLSLEAFSIYNFDHTDEVADAPRVHDYIPISKIQYDTVLDSVLDEAGAEVTDASGNVVTVSTKVTTNRSRDSRMENFKFLATSDIAIGIAEYRDYAFSDWEVYREGGFNYDSYLITGYDLGGDMLRKKQAVYLLVMNERTETVYTIGASGVELARPSSCLVQAQWDYNVTNVQGKWGRQFQAYRFLLPQPAAPASGDAFDYGPRVITTKNKLRGSGDSLSLYFQSSAGKDMKLLGWGIDGYKVAEV